MEKRRKSRSPQKIKIKFKRSRVEEMKPTVVIQPVTYENDKFTTNPSTMVDQETDFVIIFNEKHRIPVNKSLMMERCTFFNSMIKHGFKEATAKEISIGYNTDVTVFKALVHYIHHGKIQLTTANLEAVVVAAIYFQLHTLLKFCCDVMMQNIDVKTVGQVYEFAKELALVELRKAAVDFRAKHFNEIAKSKVFYEWLAAYMLEFLSSDEVEVSHEKKVLKFVFDWLNVDPNKRDEHAAELFRKLRFTFLNEKIMNEVVEGNPNKKLGQILYQVASEFENKITPRRTYDKGIYMHGYNFETSDLLGDPGFRFLRYCPDDGNITVLSKPFDDPLRFKRFPCVVNNKDIYIPVLKYLQRVFTDSMKFDIDMYDAKNDVWKPKASTIIDGHYRFNRSHVSVFDEKIFAFFQSLSRGTNDYQHFCLVYCTKTNTWQRLPALEGIKVEKSTACGDSIYMVIDGSTNILQYKPSTGELMDIPCQYNLRYLKYNGVAYKSSILFLPQPPQNTYSERSIAVLFNSETKEFRSFDMTDMLKANGIYREYLRLSLFRNFLFIFIGHYGRVFKIDLSFIDEGKEPNLIIHEDISGWTWNVEHIVSIDY